MRKLIVTLNAMIRDDTEWGLEVSLERTEICVVDGEAKTPWRGVAGTHPELIAVALARWGERLELVGLESGSTTPWLARGPAAWTRDGRPMR